MKFLQPALKTEINYNELFNSYEKEMRNLPEYLL